VPACDCRRAEYLEACERDGTDPLTATRAQVAGFVRELRTRPSLRGGNVLAMDSGAGLSNATLQQRLVPVRLFTISSSRRASATPIRSAVAHIPPDGSSTAAPVRGLWCRGWSIASQV
jgi:hypothetical protein